MALFGSASAAEKIKLMEQQGLSQSEMGGYLYSPDAGKGVKSAYSKYGNEGVYNYYNIKANADYDGNGSLKKDEVTSYLDGNGFSEEEKRRIRIKEKRRFLCKWGRRFFHCKL